MLGTCAATWVSSRWKTASSTHAAQHYQQARQAGMPALDRARAAVVQAWAERVLAGYWTHSGYMNWDTGLSFKRWHQGKKFGLAQAALLGIAYCPELRPSEVHGAWAKYILEQGFELFGSWIDRDRGLPVITGSPQTLRVESGGGRRGTALLPRHYRRQEVGRGDDRHRSGERRPRHRAGAAVFLG